VGQVKEAKLSQVLAKAAPERISSKETKIARSLEECRMEISVSNPAKLSARLMPHVGSETHELMPRMLLYSNGLEMLELALGYAPSRIGENNCTIFIKL